MNDLMSGVKIIDVHNGLGGVDCLGSSLILPENVLWHLLCSRNKIKCMMSNQISGRKKRNSDCLSDKFAQAVLKVDI